MKFNIRYVMPFAVIAGLPAAPAAAFVLDSPSIRPGAGWPAAQLLHGFGCDGGNRSPTLRWRQAPRGTKSFALTLFDPDAPTGSGWRPTGRSRA